MAEQGLQCVKCGAAVDDPGKLGQAHGMTNVTRVGKGVSAVDFCDGLVRQAPRLRGTAGHVLSEMRDFIEGAEEPAAAIINDDAAKQRAGEDAAQIRHALSVLERGDAQGFAEGKAILERLATSLECDW